MDSSVSEPTDQNEISLVTLADSDETENYAVLLQPCLFTMEVILKTFYYTYYALLYLFSFSEFISNYT